MQNQKYKFVKKINHEDTAFTVVEGYEYMKITDPEIIEKIHDWPLRYHSDFYDMFIEAWTGEIYRFMYCDMEISTETSVILNAIVDEYNPLAHVSEDSDDFSRLCECAYALTDFRGRAKEFPVECIDEYNDSEESQADIIIQFYENL